METAALWASARLDPDADLSTSSFADADTDDEQCDSFVIPFVRDVRCDEWCGTVVASSSRATGSASETETTKKTGLCPSLVLVGNLLCE